MAEALRNERAAGQLPIVLMVPLGSMPSTVKSSGFASLFKPAKPASLFEALQTARGRKPGRARPAAADSQFDLAMAKRYPLRILLAEDNLVNQKVATVMLGKFGFKPDIVGNGRLAIEALQKTPYDLVLMDVHMPEMDGLEATRRIREALPDGTRPEVIAMTASALLQDVQECLAAGMDAVVTKPVAVDELRALLEGVGQRRRSA